MRVCPECRAVYEDDIQACPEHGAALVPADFFPKDEPLEPGTMVGEYRIERKLGSGSFGDVYAGEHPLIGKRVAVKVLKPRVASEPETVSRFIAEARAVNKIRHRNIIDIFSFNVLPSGRHYFVMELLEGQTLAALLEQKGRLPLPMALHIASGVAAALDAAHEASITHRDLKPENIFLVTEHEGSYFPKLLDFGIAKLVGEKLDHQTGTGVVLGTPRYMSPEQARGKRVGPRADIYALGVMLYEMLTGSPPFTGASTMELLLKHDSEAPPPMSSVAADLPPELDAPVLAMLAKRPNDRPPSAGEAVAALAMCAADLGLAPREGLSSERRTDRSGQSTEGMSALDTSDPPQRKGSPSRWALVAAALAGIAAVVLAMMHERAPAESTNAATTNALATSLREELDPTPPPVATPSAIAVAPAPSASASASAPAAAELPRLKPKAAEAAHPSSTARKAPRRLDDLLGERE